MATLEFLGGVGTVMGSTFLLGADGHRLVVDCGLDQGLKTLRLRNREPLPLDPRSLDGVVLTHRHIDWRRFPAPRWEGSIHRVPRDRWMTAAQDRRETDAPHRRVDEAAGPPGR